MLKLGQVHLITLLFAAAYALQTLSVLCELLHLRQYERDGHGLRWRYTWLALDFVSGLTQTASELTISVVLIGLGFGWTLGLESQVPPRRIGMGMCTCMYLCAWAWAWASTWTLGIESQTPRPRTVT